MIHIEHLTKRYGDTVAVNDVSLDIEKGEVLGLLGPNGAGKTTTLRVLTGYLPPTDGTIRVGENDIRSDTLSIKGKIGYLPESAPLYQNMLVYDYLMDVAAIRGITPDRRMARVRELASICALENVMHKAIHELSKGYRQRVGLAHAMMSDPEILVLDEPTSGLDPNQIIEIREIIKEVGKEKTVIFSTHILSEAEATCDRIVIIHKGKIVADGATEELKQQASGRYTLSIKLTGTTEAVCKDVFRAVTGVFEVKTGAPEEGQVSLQLSCDAATDVRPSVYRIIRDKDWGLLEFHRESRSLETVFRELTKEN
ncbi:MAG: ABC transporter ATP-binding protein [Acidobacteria bacterium]|nr:MAG: ABC transporter ATP-binding protein [Acidobacteriota bacterium]RLE21418.1 MAG: ABC transporter ATP-binding protein [Acidobacteriota bacterium]